MKVLAKRITKKNFNEAIPLCKEQAGNNPQNWRKNETGYMHAHWLMTMIKEEKMIIHVYTDGTYEFKKIRKKRGKEWQRQKRK